jgi:predicted permease
MKLTSHLKALRMRLLDRQRTEGELEDEIQSHLAMETRLRIEAGEAPELARAAAIRDFGNVAIVKEVTRDMWGWTSLEQLGQDLRYALRTVRKNPGFALTAVLSLGLGIGATTAVFSVLDAVVLRPMPAAQPERLVILSAQKRGERWVLLNPLFDGLREKQRSLDRMFAVSDQPYLKVQFDRDAAPAYVRGSLVSGSYFPALGLTPAAGRLLIEDDDRIPGTPGSTACAAVISYDFWMRRFRRDLAALGQTVHIRETLCTLIGVAPAGFRSHQPGYAPDLWVPIRQVTDPNLLANYRMAFFSGVMGRLRKGVTASQAEAELTVIYQQLQAAVPPPPGRSGSNPISPGDVTIRLAPGAHGLEDLQRKFGQPLTLVLAVVGIVLLIAAVNVANLLLARGASRASEFATRAALGAGRDRLIRQLVTEGGLLAVFGGLFGMALAWLGTPALASLVSLRYLPIAIETRPDIRVVSVALIATALAAVLAGLLPALRLSRASLQAGMAGAGRATDGRAGRRLAHGLVAAQLALSLLLISAAGLLLRTMLSISGIDPGFRPDHVVYLDVRDESTAPSFGSIDKAEEKARLAALYRALDERLNALPGVRSASLSWLGLFGGNDLGLRLLDPDRPEDKRNAHVDYVSARYFDTIGMRIERGRGFTDSDREGALRVAVVNEALAKERFGAGDAIGRRLALDYSGEETRPFTVVGVVRNSKYNDLRENKAEPMIWVPLAQAPFRIQSATLRVQAGTEAAIARQTQAAMAAANLQLMVRKVTTLSAQVDETTARERLMLGLAGAFGGLALLLAAVGIYGTLAYAVARRTREIGLRMALGAQPGQVLKSVVGEALRLVAWSLILGLPLALIGGYALRAFLFGVEPHDVPALSAACLVLAATSMAAAYIPARRAAGVDPMTALRHE